MQRQTIGDILYNFFDTDNDSDTEVPYADIMITVRGVSTPELTQVGYLTPGDQKEVRDFRVNFFVTFIFLNSKEAGQIFVSCSNLSMSLIL